MKNTWDAVLAQRGNYHPENEYFMVDYIDGDSCSHIRLPFLRQEQMFEITTRIMGAISLGADIRNFRVMPETFLDSPLVTQKFIDECAAAGVVDSEELGVTAREWFFDSRYQSIAECFKNIECSLQKSK